jgi:hypothetical protein
MQVKLKSITQSTLKGKLISGQQSCFHFLIWQLQELSLKDYTQQTIAKILEKIVASINLV